MGPADIPTILLAVGGVGVAIGFAIVAGKTAAHLLYAASGRSRPDDTR